MSRLSKVLVALVGTCPVCLGYWIASREVRAATAEVARLGREFGNVPEPHPPGFYRGVPQQPVAEETRLVSAASAHGRLP